MANWEQAPHYYQYEDEEGSTDYDSEEEQMEQMEQMEEEKDTPPNWTDSFINEEGLTWTSEEESSYSDDDAESLSKLSMKDVENILQKGHLCKCNQRGKSSH